MKENRFKRVFVSSIASLCLVNNINILANNNISLEKDCTQDHSLQELDIELTKLTEKRERCKHCKQLIDVKFVNMDKFLLGLASIVFGGVAIVKTVECRSAEKILENLLLKEYVREYLGSKNKSGIDKESSEKNIVVDEKLDHAYKCAYDIAQYKEVAEILKSVHNYINTVSKTNDVVKDNFDIFQLPEIYVIARLWNFYCTLKNKEILKENDLPKFMKTNDYSGFDDLKGLSGEERVYTFLNKLYELFPSVFINPVLDRFSCKLYFNALDNYLFGINPEILEVL